MPGDFFEISTDKWFIVSYPFHRPSDFFPSPLISIRLAGLVRCVVLHKKLLAPVFHSAHEFRCLVFNLGTFPSSLGGPVVCYQWWTQFPLVFGSDARS